MKRTLSLALSVVVASILPLSAWAQTAGSLSGPGHMWQGGWHGWYAGPLMMLFFIAIVVAVVVLHREAGQMTANPTRL